jgi:hypothetical protein
MIQKSEIRSQGPVLIVIGTISVLFALGGSIHAEEPPTITVSKGNKINLIVSPLTGSEGAAITKILQNDLMLSGYFTFGGKATLSPSRKAMQRKPSHFGSYCHCLPAGISSTERASIGGSGGFIAKAILCRNGCRGVCVNSRKLSESDA